MAKEWKRIRFRVWNADDSRPIKFPPPGPYWVTGYGHEDGRDYAVLVAFLPYGEDVMIEDFWPDTDGDAWDGFFHQRHHQRGAKLTFTDRFPKPDWWQDDESPPMDIIDELAEALVNAAVPLEALKLAGLSHFSQTAQDEIENGIAHARAAIKRVTAMQAEGSLYQGYGASYSRDDDGWHFYTMPDTQPFDLFLKGYQRSRLDFVITALRAAEETRTPAFDLEPDIGATTREPSLRHILRKYYEPHFDKDQVEVLVEKYITNMREQIRCD